MSISYIVLSGHDSSSADDFNGTPFSLISALRAKGLDARGVRLLGREYGLIKPLWALGTVALERSIPRGYQYSWIARRIRDLRFALAVGKSASVVVCLYQLPPRLPTSANLIMYVDGTLSQLFDSYAELRDVSARRRSRALEIERRAYLRASRVVTKTTESKDRLVSFYGVDEDRIVTAPPPPNIDVPTAIASASLRPSNAVRFVAIARDWERKNLDACVELVDTLNKAGRPAELAVVGIRAQDAPLQDIPEWLHFHGVLDRSRSSELARIVGSAHIGLLMSRAEIAGIALLEYQAAGLVVMCSGVGGMPDVLLTSECYVVDLDDISGSASMVRAWIDSGSLDEMLRRASAESSTVPDWNDVASLIVDGATQA